jgi:hypothetical protein
MPRAPRPSFGLIATLLIALCFACSYFTASVEAAEARPVAKAPAIAKPWQSAVRIKVRLSDKEASCGSGTIIASQADQTFILTCAHVFNGGDPRSFNKPITVDLFDGVLGGKTRQQVKFVRTVPGKCLDFDEAKDVGLITINAGEVLPATPPVPAGWSPSPGEHLTTVGCGNCEDATAFSTDYIRSIIDSIRGYRGLECTTRPREGRSGGGLHRSDGRVCGVTDFAVTEVNVGWYAAPTSIHEILDRNGLKSIYETARPAAPKAVAPERRPIAAPPADADADEDVEVKDGKGPAKSREWVARFNPFSAWHWAALTGPIFALISIARGWIRFPSSRPASPTAASPVDYVKFLVDLMKATDERAAKDKQASDLYDQIRDLVKQLEGKPAAPPLPK